MIYRNRETGATIDVVSELGGVWEPVKAPASGKRAEPVEAREPVKDPAIAKPAKAARAKAGKKPSAKQKDDEK